MSEEDDVEAVAALFEDETTRTILTELHMQPATAADLRDRCDVSGPTVYRRLEELRERDLLVERTRLDPSDGHHRTVYDVVLDRATFELDDGEVSVRLERREDMADRFTRLVEEM